VAGDDVVAIEAVLVGPGVKQQARLAGTQHCPISSEELVVLRAPTDARYAAGVKVYANAEAGRPRAAN
jgi:hypothetical protein